MKTGLKFVTPGFIIQGRSRKKECNFDPYKLDMVSLVQKGWVMQ